MEHKLDTTKKINPYGFWLDYETGEEKFYDRDKRFYDNTEEIKTMQAETKS